MSSQERCNLLNASSVLTGHRAMGGASLLLSDTDQTGALAVRGGRGSVRCNHMCFRRRPFSS